MDLLLAANTVAQAQADTAPASGTPGWATDGNPATGVMATDAPAWHYNMMMSELLAIIKAAGITPSNTDWSQVLKAMQTIFASAQYGVAPYNAKLAQLIGGYPAGVIVAGTTAGAFWVSTTNANLSVPGADGAAWQSLFNGYATQAWSTQYLVNSGGGTGGSAAGVNKIFLSWLTSKLRLGVDGSDLGNIALESWVNQTFLQLANAAVQTVAGPVTFSGITKVPTPTDYTQKQAIGASDADARYARLSGGNTFSGNQVVSAGYLQLQSTTAGKYATMQSVVSGGVTLLNCSVGALVVNLREDTGRFYMAGSASGATAFQSDFYVITGGAPVANGSSVSASVSWTPTATGVALVTVTAATHNDSINTTSIALSGSGYDLLTGGMQCSGSPQVMGTYFIHYTVGTAVTLNAKTTFASACNGEIRLYINVIQNGE